MSGESEWRPIAGEVVDYRRAWETIIGRLDRLEALIMVAIWLGIGSFSTVLVVLVLR